MLKIFGLRILTKNEYENITGQVYHLSNATNLLNCRLDKLEGRRKCFTQKGRYGSHDLLPFDDALALMDKQFRADVSKQITPTIEIELHPDGVTRDVKMKFEWLDYTDKG
jgi:hypothetical protein